jgi:heme exporter protein B
VRSLRLAAAVAAKDLRIELRGRHAAGLALPFASTLLLAFGLALGPGRTPVDKASVFAGKAAAMAVELLVLEGSVLVMVAVLFGLPLGRGVAVIVAALALGTVGLAAVGSLFGVLAVVPRAREAALPLLVMPLATPVLVAGVKATELAVAGRGGDAGSWLGLLAAFDLVFLAAGTLVFEFLVEE